MATTETKTMATNGIRFFYNGLKVGKGELQKGRWSLIERHEAATYTIETQIVLYGSVFPRFSDEIVAAFEVENNSDSMTDYFEDDQIRFRTNHPRFADAAAAMIKACQKGIARNEKKGRIEDVEYYRQEMAKVEALLG
jgi:hypothetical protein